MNTAVVNVVRLVDKNKAIIAFVTPFVLTILGVIANWAITGEFNGQEIRIAVGGLITSAGTALSVYAKSSSRAVVELGPPIPEAPVK